jgi:hypothetical protein
MEFRLFYELCIKLKTVFSRDKIYPLWRQVLCFFSTDFFIQFKVNWVYDFQNINLLKNRTTEIFYFIIIFISIKFIFYTIMELPLRILFHGFVKKMVLRFKEIINQGIGWEKKRNTLEFISIITPFFHKYLFKYGIISSNDLNDPINFDVTTKEKEFNEGMSMLYRWILTIIHTLLVSIIVWEFYSVWFFVIVLIVLIISIVLGLLFTVLMINLDYLETLRLKLLKENKKLWK